jgi:hypothetical protein
MKMEILRIFETLEIHTISTLWHHPQTGTSLSLHFHESLKSHVVFSLTLRQSLIQINVTLHSSGWYDSEFEMM